MHKHRLKPKIIFLITVSLLIAGITCLFYVSFDHQAPDEIATLLQINIQQDINYDDFITVPDSPPSQTITDIEQLQEPLAYKCCTPMNASFRENVYYLKTHKTGSSTVQNIILRFALKHSLDVMNVIYGTYHWPFSDASIYQHVRTPNNKYNVLAHHMRYTSTLKRYQYPNTSTITTIRHPAYLFQSLYNYFRVNDTTGMNFQQFLNTPKKPPFIVTPCMFMIYVGYNQMSKDLGFSLESNAKNQSAIDEFIEKIDREFDFVMITEFMDESLVLLANLMGWPLEYVTYLKINERPRDSFTYDNYTLTSHDKLVLMELNQVDTQLYHHFLQKFFKCAKQYGANRLKQDVIRLRILNQQLKERCVEREYVSNLWLGYSKIIEYKPKNASDLECYYATRFATELDEIVVTEQYKRLRLNSFQSRIMLK